LNCWIKQSFDNGKFEFIKLKRKKKKRKNISIVTAFADGG
jgi:hypothetical protein